MPDIQISAKLFQDHLHMFTHKCVMIKVCVWFVCPRVCMWLDSFGRLETAAVVSTVSGVDRAPCISNIWHAVVRRGAVPYCHRTPSHSPASSREHNRQCTQQNHPSVRFPHSFPHLLWSFSDSFHLAWWSWFHSLLIFYIHLRPTGDVNLCQPHTHEAFIPDLIFCLQSATK